MKKNKVIMGALETISHRTRVTDEKLEIAIVGRCPEGKPYRDRPGRIFE
jgi:hypothetical protein